jgi:UDP-glucose 4-epimerase
MFSRAAAMKILIIGGAGFLGANLVRRCLRDPGNEVTVLDSLDPRLRSTVKHLTPVWDQINFVRGSMNDEPVIAQQVQSKDVIFNCAAQTSHPLSIQDPLFDAELNCLGNLRLLETVRLLNPHAVVLYTSSSTVIGKATVDVIDEQHPERPLDIYSANKGVAEKYYRIFHRVHDIKTISIRFANLYGPFGKPYPEFGFVNYFIDLAWRNDEIRIWGSGEQRRNVMFVDDAVEVLYRAASTSDLVGESFFAAHSEHLSVAQIAASIVKELGRGTVVHSPWPDERRRIEIDDVRISSEALKARLDWQPRYSFAEGLRQTRLILEG